MNLLERLPVESNRTYAYRILKTNIMNLTLLPGTGISETELSKLLQLSRTPIREALILLEKERLIDVLPKRKSRVALIHLQLVYDAIFVREVIEKEIIHEACEKLSPNTLVQLENNLEIQKTMVFQGENYSSFHNLDNLFHSSIYEGIQKKNIWNTVEDMSTHYNRLRQLDAVKNFSLQAIVTQHEELIDIIKNKNHDAVDEFVSAHLRNIFHKLDDVQEEFGEYIVD